MQVIIFSAEAGTLHRISYAVCGCNVQPTHWMGHDQTEPRTYRCPEHGDGWRKARLLRHAVFRRLPRTAPFYDCLDPGIRDLVRLLRDNFCDTVDSGDGVSKPPEHRTMDVPHVFCRVRDNKNFIKECHRVKGILEVHGLYATPTHELTSRVFTETGSTSTYTRGRVAGFYVEGSYDPESEVGIVMILGLSADG